jgi:SAM-dependent methyltransferase
MNTTPRIADLTPHELRAAVADRYGEVATQATGTFNFPVGRCFAEDLGYPADVLDTLPSSAVASFAGVTWLPRWTALPRGNVVVELGSGAGLDALIAAQTVGVNGRVHAIDISDDMVRLARSNAEAAGLCTIQAHQTPVDKMPIDDEIADAVIANGVLNLAPEKERVVAEAFRVLKPGGRYVGAEIVLGQELSDTERDSLDDWYR